jgi:hypothetical protein
VAGLAGYSAAAKIGTNTILEMGEWSLDVERNIEDDTEFGDSWESGVATLGKWSGSVKGRWDMAGTQQAACQTALLNGTTIALRLYATGSLYYSGNAYITKITPSATVSGLVEVELSFQGTGALSYT